VSVHFPVQRFELVPDLGLGAADQLPPDPTTVCAKPKRDRSDVPVLLPVEVDPVLAMTAAAGGLRLWHKPESNGWSQQADPRKRIYNHGPAALREIVYLEPGTMVDELELKSLSVAEDCSTGH
jgi:hypothetical protein